MNILHILNGDSTAHSFSDTGLEGDILVWREIFSQGPLSEDIDSAEFWKKREEWICHTFTEQAAEYDKVVVGPLEKLKEPYDEINLWFEFDLHCQVNLLGVLALIAKNTDLSPPAIYLICPGDFPGKPIFRGMGELNGEELLSLYDSIRVELGEPDFAVAAEAWKQYVRSDAGELKKWINETHFWGALELLKPALEAHLNRLLISAEGLNGVEQRLLDIYRSGAKTRHAIYQQFWDVDKIYGMGDLELDLYLDRLKEQELVMV
jgi:hypothetical protein